MSKKTLALILFLFLVTCGLLYVALITPGYKKPTTSAPSPTPMSVNAHTLLSLTPAPASQSSKLNQYTLAVTIDTGDNSVNSVQLELSYDPQALTNVTLAPGTFFKQPNALLNTVNTADGRISYALIEQADLPGKKGTGTVAFISFNLSPTFSGQSTQITFLPKTAVAADKVLESVLQKATGYTIVIPTPSQQTGTSSAQ